MFKDEIDQNDSHIAEMRTKGRSSGGLMDASHTDITTINLRQIKM